MQHKQGSQEWFNQRKGLVTASVAGAILGHSPFDDRDSVMRSMVRKYHGAESEFSGNIATQWGNDHEAEALLAMEKNIGVMVEACGFTAHEDWLGASPDGLTHNSVIEVKCPFKKEMFSLDSRKDYMAQVQIQMYCTGKERAYFGIWVPGYIQVTPVEIDTAWLCEALPLLKEFHDEYLAIIADPELSGPYLEDIVQDMSKNSDWEELARNYQYAKRMIADYEREANEYKEKLISLANGRKSSGAGLLVFPVAGRSSTDYKKMLADNPEISVDEYTKVGKGSWSVRVDKGEE